MNLCNGKSTFAIYADIGTLGEGSVALADALGVWSDARSRGESDEILYLFRAPAICGHGRSVRSRARVNSCCCTIRAE